MDLEVVALDLVYELQSENGLRTTRLFCRLVLEFELKFADDCCCGLKLVLLQSSLFNIIASRRENLKFSQKF